jgi:hypothetical protein
MKRSTKIWVGIGAFVMTGGGYTAISSTPAVTAPAPDAGSSICSPSRKGNAARVPLIRFAQASQGGEGGEGGGEGGEAGAANLPLDLKFALSIALIRGHLLIGDQLVGEKQWDAAFPHFMHPVEELYDGIKDQVADYNTPQFLNELNALAKVVEAKNAKDYVTAKRKVDAALAKADAGIKAKHADGVFALQTALEAMKVAAGEYQAAIVGDKIAKPVEYQDARGFILYADALIDRAAAGLEKKDAAAFKKLRVSVAELKKVFPTAMPPKKPVKSAGAMRALVSRVELAAGDLI